MVNTKEFVDFLIEKGFTEFCGVPCSNLKYLINECINRGIYTPFTNEGDAVAYAAGKTVGGQKTAVLMQNSGLTNASSPISSLTSLYDIPLLYIIGWRGKGKDEPQHKIIGPNTRSIINDLTSPNLTAMCTIIDRHPEDYKEDYNDETQCFFLIEKDTFTEVSLKESDDEYDENPKRSSLIKKIYNKFKDDDNVMILSTTGFTSRELLSLEESSKKHFYMFGSMGCLLSFAVGLAKSHPEKKFVVLDGDGAASMRLESTVMADIIAPPNLLRIIFANGTHQSTGKQSFNSDEFMNFIHDGLMGEVDYCNEDKLVLYSIENLDQMKTIIYECNNSSDKDLPRPTLTPQEILANFKEGLSK